MSTASWLGFFIIAIPIYIIIMLLIRPIILWYRGVSQREKQLDQVIKLLTEIKNNRET